METITLDHNINVFYITAKSFPDGIIDAHKALYELTHSEKRIFFGISRPEDGSIIYKAAAEEINQEEAKKLNCDKMVLKKGNYISLTVIDYMKDIQSIDRAFQQLLSYPGLDPNGYCVEWYSPAGKAGLNATDVKCMIRLKE